MTIHISNVTKLEIKLDKVWRVLPEFRDRNELVIKLLEEGTNELIKKNKIRTQWSWSLLQKMYEPLFVRFEQL